MGTKTFSVNEMSEKLNKSKSVIYSYLKNGKLKGTKKSEGIGAWEIEYDENIEMINRESEDLKQTPITTKIIINENVYMIGLQKSLNKCEKAIEDITANLEDKFNILSTFDKIKGTTSFTNNLPKKLKDLIDNDENYIYLNKNRNALKTEVLGLSDNYEELNSIIKPLNIKEIHYSKISESVYVIIDKNNLISFLNRLSEKNKRFIIVSEDLMSRDLIKFRFSNHIPDYYKNETMTIMNKERDVDVMVPYSELEKNLDCAPKKQNDEDIKIIKEINKKITIVKKYSARPLKKLNKFELKNYYEVSNELLNDEKACKDKFVSELPGRLPGIIKRLKSNGITV